MKGCRPLTLSEIERVSQAFSGPYELRDRALFILGLKTAFRVSELLSLSVGDLMENGQFVDRVCVKRCHMKKKIEGRTVPLHSEAKEAIGLWVAQLERTGKVSPSTYLFMSRQGENKPLTRLQAWRNLKRAFKQAGLIGPGLATHSLRKSYCAVLHEKLGRDIVKLARAMGHKNISSTAHYLSFKDEEIDQAILTT